MGAKVINVSVTACLPAADPMDQRSLGAAVWYAATVKDAVVVAAICAELASTGCVMSVPASRTVPPRARQAAAAPTGPRGRDPGTGPGASPSPAPASRSSCGAPSGPPTGPPSA